MEAIQPGALLPFGAYTWRVLDIRDGAALLVTEDIIGQDSYHDAYCDITWADCALRAYLNGAFYDGFTPADRARIVPVRNANPGNEWYGTAGGGDTRDSVFLLSVEDVTCRYFGDSSGLLRHPGRNQRYWFERKDANNYRRRANFEGSVWWWWLRSPERVGVKAVYVHGGEYWDSGQQCPQGESQRWQVHRGRAAGAVEEALRG